MAHLKFYAVERKEFHDAFDRQLTERECEIVFGKLKRHFKLRMGLVIGGRRAMASPYGGRVQIPRRALNFGILIHEVGHILHAQRYGHEDGERWHGKKLRRAIRLIEAYCQRKNWWGKELRARTAPKPEKPRPSNLELLDRRIETRKGQIRQLERKLKLYQTLLKKRTRSLSALERQKGS